MKEIDFINSLCAMRKTRLASLRFSSSYWRNAPLIRLHYPVSWTSSKSSSQNKTSIHWFSLLGFWMNSQLHLSPCMWLSSSSKVNTLSLELHQPTSLLFLLKHQSRTFASDSSNLTEIHEEVTKIVFPMVNLIWAIEKLLGPQVSLVTVDVKQNRTENNFPLNAIFG